MLFWKDCEALFMPTTVNYLAQLHFRKLLKFLILLSNKESNFSRQSASKELKEAQKVPSHKRTLQCS